MATMLRPNKKAAKIAYRLLGNPPNGYKQKVKKPKQQINDSSDYSSGGVLTH